MRPLIPRTIRKFEGQKKEPCRRERSEEAEEPPYSLDTLLVTSVLASLAITLFVPFARTTHQSLLQVTPPTRPPRFPTLAPTSTVSKAPQGKDTTGQQGHWRNSCPIVHAATRQHFRPGIQAIASNFSPTGGISGAGPKPIQ